MDQEVVTRYTKLRTPVSISDELILFLSDNRDYVGKFPDLSCIEDKKGLDNKMSGKLYFEQLAGFPLNISTLQNINMMLVNYLHHKVGTPDKKGRWILPNDLSKLCGGLMEGSISTIMSRMRKHISYSIYKFYALRPDKNIDISSLIGT